MWTQNVTLYNTPSGLHLIYVYLKLDGLEGNDKKLNN